MQTDAVQLAFNFAKEIATQLITLSTGLLALSIAFTKDILQGVPKGKERRLKAAWGVLIVSIVCGVWTLSALTGTLMPVNPSDRPNPLQFKSNVRIPDIVAIKKTSGKRLTLREPKELRRAGDALRKPVSSETTKTDEDALPF